MLTSGFIVFVYGTHTCPEFIVLFLFFVLVTLKTQNLKTNYKSGKNGSFNCSQNDCKIVM